MPSKAAPPLHIDLAGNLDAKQVGELALLGAVTLVDDMGQIYTLPGAPTSQRGGRWIASLTVPEAPEGVRKIRSIEGTLYAWREAKSVSTDLTLPVAGETVRARIDGCEVELQPITPAMANRGPKATCRFALPPGRITADGSQDSDHVSLVGQSGTVYAAALNVIGWGGDPARSVLTVEGYFSPIQETVKAVRVKLLLTSGMTSLAHVRLANIAVEGRSFKAPKREREPGLSAPPQLADPAGGFLVIPEMADPAVRGALLVGIAPITQGKAGALHWKEIPLPHMGLTRIGPIRSGDYRVVASFCPDAPTGQAACRWPRTSDYWWSRERRRPCLSPPVSRTVDRDNARVGPPASEVIRVTIRWRQLGKRVVDASTRGSGIGRLPESGRKPERRRGYPSTAPADTGSPATSGSPCSRAEGYLLGEPAARTPVPSRRAGEATALT